MTAERLLTFGAVVFVLFDGNLVCHATESQVGLCLMCDGTVLNGSAVWNFCTSSAGEINGRCCLQKDNTSGAVCITGLDISHCNLSVVEDLSEASTSTMIDLSFNPISNLSDLVFQGFSQLSYVILPSNLTCPGGNASWEKTEVNSEYRLCEGQINACNQTGHMSWDCPQNSLCSPYGPSFFACSCAEDFHGYKCLREGEFPTAKVFGILGGSTVLTSILLWVTQRRKAKAM
ncbi:hypothetical protein AALO_G00109790 [Alosa alosa]|uniref:EGF-like domain-containing protein n=1 Tax=Alosa alosa TaxID=278164 RepID=A0AAV6GNV2_9TELE|nr:all-trans retinoic acid-induced differentiation factor [Alosa alosa]KAG5276793.1 hypothetical protein AALO_G00109790 [Alosa alosa]